MNAKELMVGDWVMAIDTPAKVMGIDTVSPMEQIWVETADDGCNPFSPEQISPIPLVDEILAENGFIKYNDSRRLFVNINEYNGFCLFLNPDDYGYHLYNYRFVRVDDVHVLQHILRDFGIERKVVI